MKLITSFQKHRLKYLFIIGGVVIAIAVIASWLKWNGPLRSFDQGPAIYTQYNNYVIFKSAFKHLVEGQELYQHFPQEHHDLYKYSPGFALVFGVFTLFPDVVGLILWNLLNVLAFVLILMRKESAWASRFPLLFLFLLPELVTSTQNCQSNALMTGLIVLAYLDFESSRSPRAAIWIVLASFIKIYAGLAALLFLFYPQKIRFLIYALSSALILFFLPMILISPDQWWMQYQGWWRMLTQDHEASLGLSFMQVIHLISPQFDNKIIVQIGGLLSLLILLFPSEKFNKGINRINYLALILIAMIIFNHKSESATFIVAVTGIGIWFFSKEIITRVDWMLITFVFLFTVLSPTDLFPLSFRREWLVPYGVKVWPCILVYLKIGYELIKASRQIETPFLK